MRQTLAYSDFAPLSEWIWQSTLQPPEMPAPSPDGLPKISIITPSFNQGRFLEETIRSVLLQGYDNLEYIVIDGGSRDNSVAILRKYDPWITCWVSEPDRGQAHAINKGFQKATGDLVGWINSDDMLLPGALQQLALAHAQNPTMILAGDVLNYSQTTGRLVRIRQKNINLPNMIAPVLSPMIWHQPGIYVPARFCKGNFLVDETMRYFFDQDWLCKILKETSVYYLSEPVAVFRLHASSKTVGEKHAWVPEQEKVTKRYWDRLTGVNKPKILAFFKIVSASIFLGKTQWNRKKGMALLSEAVRIYPPVVFSKKFMSVALRCLFPYRYLIFMRSILIKLHLHMNDEE